MMGQKFENIVKEAFDNFEADVNPQAWMNIQQGLQVTPPAPAQPTVPVTSIVKTASSISKLAVSYITASAVVLITAVGTWYYLNNTKEEAQTNRELNGTRAEEKAIIPEVNSNTTIEVQPGNENNKAPLTINGGQAQNGNNQSEEKKSKAAADFSQDNEKVKTKEAEPAKNISKVSPGSVDQLKQAISKDETTASSNTQKNINPTEVKELIETYSAEPVAYIVANPVSGSAPLTVSFLNNGYARTSNWDFGDGSEVEFENNVTHIFKTAGSYKVKLVATDKNGVVSTNEITIMVKETEPTGNSSLAEIQNVFTPNGDGYNDVFSVRGNNISRVSALIFNSMGKEVYQWTGVEGSWDGKFANGLDAPDGSYFFIIEATGTDSKIFRFKGVVRLIR